MSNQNPQLQLDIDAQVVRQLGEELITDPEQALLELVKNSFDADSGWCNVVIDTRYSIDVNTILPGSDLSSKNISVNGKICIEDNGIGMDEDAIRRGWLTISLSPKRAFKAQGKVTPKYNRTPLGDKGLGRLGSMKLGDFVRITTFSSKSGKGLQVTLNWNECRSGVPLSSVTVHKAEVPSIGRTGTKLEIFGLRDTPYWTGEKRLEELRFKLSTLISPFKPIDGFTVALTCDDKIIDLISLPQSFLNSASMHFEMLWDNSTLELTGFIKLQLFKTQGKDKAEQFEELIRADGGEELFNFLREHNRCKGLNLKRSKSKKWFIEFTDIKPWDILQKARSDSSRQKPGPIVGELYGFELDSASIADFATDIGEYRQQVKNMAGIFVFRDNFRVRMGSDWLKLGEAWTSGGSYYGLKPTNTLGYVAITSKDNPGLIEKSDREGFVDNPDWQGLVSVCEGLKKFANDSMENIRRAASEFTKLKSQHLAPANVPIERRVEDLSQILAAAKKITSELKGSETKRSALLSKARSVIQNFSTDEKIDKGLRRQVEDALGSVNDMVEQISNETKQAQGILEELSSKQNYSEQISERFFQLKNQIDEVYDMVATGLAAQGLVHEIHPLLDEVNTRILGIKSRLKKETIKDPSILTEIEMIRSVNSVLSRKIAFINPMMRTFRETRSSISIKDFLVDYFSNRKDRYDSLGIKSVIDISKENNIIIEANTGRLTQIVDNIVRNSEYWLLKKNRDTANTPKEIHLTISKSSLIVWDTGPGVRPNVESSLFEIFVSDKPKGEGHGLGLFIVSQLLESQGCSISLGKERNANGNRYKFIIDLSAIVK